MGVGREDLFTGQRLRQKARCREEAEALQDSLNFGFRLGFVSAVVMYHLMIRSSVALGVMSLVWR